MTTGRRSPSEIRDEEEAEEIRQKAQEFGVTTGRARRIGWFDGVAAKYSQLVNGFTGIVLTRLDILDEFDSVKVCVGYEVNGERLDRFPAVEKEQKKGLDDAGMIDVATKQASDRRDSIKAFEEGGRE